MQKNFSHTIIMRSLTVLIFAFLLSIPVWSDRNLQAAQLSDRVFLPLGGEEGKLLDDLAEKIIMQAHDDPIRILLLPSTYASNPIKIDTTERNQIIGASQTLRDQLEVACRQIAAPAKTCEVEMAPVFVRSQADQQDLENFFRPGLTAVFIPEGRAGTPSQVIQDTFLERLLAQAYQNGVIIAGSSTGAMLFSKEMINGYRSGYNRGNSLNFGSVEIGKDSIRGMEFGLQSLVIDTHYFQRGRFGRLLNAISLPGIPSVGIGIDSNNGAQITNERIIEGVFGDNPLTILDLQTYHSAEGVSYQGNRHAIRLRNVLFHLLASGDFWYDLQKREHSLAAPRMKIERNFDSLSLPLNAGPLIISSSFSGDFSAIPTINLLTNLSGGTSARIAIILTDRTDPAWIDQTEKYLQKVLPVEKQFLVPSEDSRQPLVLPQETSGIILWGKDQSNVQISQLRNLRSAWLDGTPLLAIDAGSSLIGGNYNAFPENPDDEQSAEFYTQEVLKKGKAQMSVGLGLISANIESNLSTNNRWARLIVLAYNHPEKIAFGLNQDASILLDQNGARVVGQYQVISLDLREAKLSVGDNQSFVIANGLLDIFTYGDPLRPEVANTTDVPIRMATPILALPAPTRTARPQAAGRLSGTASAPEAVETQQALQGQNLEPDATPTDEVKITDPRYLQSMILFAVLSVMIILLGVWISRGRIDSR